MDRAVIVVGLGFGDEGKGATIDALARERSSPATVVRFNGGSQAAHNVVAPDGRQHTFAQLGSATLVPGCRTHLSRFMLLDPFALAVEARALGRLGVDDALSRLTVSVGCKLITPFQKAANRLRESLRRDRHGSCGMGIGETMADSLATPALGAIAADLRRPALLVRKLRDLQEAKRAEFSGRICELSQADRQSLRDELRMLSDPRAPELFAEALSALAAGFTLVDDDFLKSLAEEGPLLFEGAQGVLLDEWYGFHPFTTWSTTTTANALTLLDEIGFEGQVERLGVLRAYHTRHGAGPFPTEDAGLEPGLPEMHNGQGPWQGAFRVGLFDAVLARYALAVCPVDSLALTHLDRLEAFGGRAALAYRWGVETLTELPVKGELEDLGFQESLTALIRSGAPLSAELGLGEEAFVAGVEELCGAPVSLLARGPTAGDRERRLVHA